MNIWLLLSFLSGFISLSQEIFWFRLVGYATAGSPYDFAYVLGLFLLGLAIGAKLTKNVSPERQVAVVGNAFIQSGIVFLFSIPVTAFLFTYSVVVGTMVLYAFVFVIALLSGAVFPIICHKAVEGSRNSGNEQTVGMKLSVVYLVNVVGCTSGSLIMGFVLLDYYSLPTLALATAIFAAAIGLYVARRDLNSKSLIRSSLFACLAAGMFWSFKDSMYERIHFKNAYSNTNHYKYLLENKSGVIAVDQNDIIFGGGIFDGSFNASPFHDTNGIIRGYFAASLMSPGTRVLVIGLSSGSWVKVLANQPNVSEIIVVEINPGYTSLIEKYPSVKSILTDPRIKIVVDDGRRWLRTNPNEKFDFVLMNTTFHWRSHITNLLSLEYVDMVKSHLNPSGYFFYNTTFLDDVIYTAAQRFSFVYKFGNFVLGTNRSALPSVSEREQNLRAMVDENGLIFNPENPESEPYLREKMLEIDVSNMHQRFNKPDEFVAITDDNMYSEFKNKIYSGKHRPWSEIFSRDWLE